MQPQRQPDLFEWLSPDLGDGDEYERYARTIEKRLEWFFIRKNCPEASELASETLLRVIRALSNDGMEDRPIGARHVFLQTTATHVWLEWLRRPAASETELTDQAVRNATWRPPSLEESVIKERCAELLRKLVEEILPHLSETRRTIIRMRYYNADRTPKLAKIGALLGLSHDATRQYNIRAHKDFRKLVETSERLPDLLRCLGLRQAA